MSSLVPKMKSLVFALVVAGPLMARGDYREFREVPVDSALVEDLNRTAEATLKEFPTSDVRRLTYGLRCCSEGMP